MVGRSKNFNFVSFVSVKQLNNLNDDLKKLKEEKNKALQNAKEEIDGMTTVKTPKTRA